MAMGGASDMCDSCNAKHQLSVAVKWCPECEEKLCEGCVVNHSLSKWKLLRNHTIIKIEDFKNIPESILENKNFCNQHDMNLSSFCPQHDVICCPACITGSGAHFKCETLLIQDVIKTANTPALLRSMQGGLQRIQKNIRAIIKDRQTNIQQLHEQRQKIVKEIKQTKEKILKQLNVMERKMMENITSRVGNITTQLESDIADLEERLRKSENLLKSTSALLDFGSDVQTYIGSKTIEVDVARQINSLQDFVDSGSLKRFGLKLEGNHEDDMTVGSSNLFGTASEDVTSVSVTLISDLDKQVQIMSLPSELTIDDVKLSLKVKLQINTKRNDVYDCSVIPPDRIVVANFGRSCITILKENGYVETKIQISPELQGITVINNNTVAVSCDNDVKIINITNGNTKKTIPTGNCHGVEYYNGSLICCVPGKGVVSVDLKSNNITTIVQDTGINGHLYCTVYRYKIYISRYAHSTITCYSMKGDKVWEYSDTSVISGPLGIVVDNSSNVYVASYNNHTLVILSPDGKRSRTLLTREDVLNGPTALHFNRENNQLIVFNENGSGFLFKI